MSPHFCTQRQCDALSLLLLTHRYTEHSGCPVLSGEKWITTAWMRDGVSKADPWTLFDPTGVRLLEEEATSKTNYYYKERSFDKNKQLTADEVERSALLDEVAVSHAEL